MFKIIMNIVQEIIESGMRNKREEARDDLRKRLVDAAEARIASQGLAALKAREVTADAGCALGALYTAFDDLDRLILQVNSRTLVRLGLRQRTAWRPWRRAMLLLLWPISTFGRRCSIIVCPTGSRCPSGTGPNMRC